MNLTNEQIETIKKLQYENFLDKCIRKNKLQIIVNPSGFVRGIPSQLASDMFILALNRIDKTIDHETLVRLKIICKYFINAKSKRRQSYDLPNSKTKVLKDKFTVYEEQLRQIESLLRDS